MAGHPRLLPEWRERGATRVRPLLEVLSLMVWATMAIRAQDDYDGNPGGTSSDWQTSTSYTDSGLFAGTQYTYTVATRDAMGSAGPASAPVSATTEQGQPLELMSLNFYAYGNYIIFRGLRNPSLTLRVWGNGFNHIGPAGFQIVKDSSGVIPPGPAGNPNPSSGSVGHAPGTDLSWTGGLDAASRNVYFGTNPMPGESEFRGNQTATNYDPGTPDYSEVELAQLQSDNFTAYPDFNGNVAVVDTQSFSFPPNQSPADQGFHWNRHAGTYYEIGKSMAQEMQTLIMIRTQ